MKTNKYTKRLNNMLKYPKTANPDKAARYLFKIMQARRVSFSDFCENNGFAPISDGKAIVSENQSDIADMTAYPDGYIKNAADIYQDQQQTKRIRESPTHYVVYNAATGNVHPVHIRDVKACYQDLENYLENN